MTAYCTATRLVSLIADLRVLPNTRDLSQSVLDDGLSKDAVKVTAAVNRRGYSPRKDAPIDEIIPVLNASQSLILALTNLLLSGKKLFDERATEVDGRYQYIADKHEEFLELPLYLLKDAGAFSRAFNNTRQGYPIPTHRPYTSAIAFTGTGDNNLALSGDYSGKLTATYTIELIDATHFHWKKNSGAYSGSIAITGAAQSLSDGLSITLPAGTHNAGDKWVITITVYASIYSVPSFCAPYDPDAATPIISNAVVNDFLDLWTPAIYAIAPGASYPHTNPTITQARKWGEIITEFAAAMVLQAICFKSPRGSLDIPAYKRVKSAINLSHDLRSGKLYQDFKS